MARKTRSIKDLQAEAAAAEARGLDVGDAAPKKRSKTKDPSKEKEPKAPKVKKPAAARPKRTKAKAVIRKRIQWVIFSSTMKEEGRFPYSERAAAEKRVEELAAKHKRTYFIQPLKEPISAKPSDVAAEEAPAG
jgi:hypothetical protein